MGVKNLLNFVDHAIRPAKLGEFSGKRIALDVSCLIYRGIYNGDCEKYVMSFVKMLVRYGCTVVVVFDGKPPSAKEKALDLRHNNGIRMTDDHVAKVKAVVYDHPSVDIIQAPYEADAQLAYLSKHQLVDAIVTEDADLIAYGCEKIIYKLCLNATCQVYERRKLCLPYAFPVFRWACILAGCDYMVGGLRGLGMIKATQTLARIRVNEPYDDEEIRRCLHKCRRQYKNIDAAFIANFIKAEHSFLYQKVLDPRDNSITYLNEPPPEPNVNLNFFLNLKFLVRRLGAAC